MRIVPAITTGLTLLFACCALTGCENSEVWDELNGTPPPTVTRPGVAQPQPAPAEPMPLPAAPPAAGGNYLRTFQSLRPFEITDEHMRELTSQSDGLEELTELNLERSKVTSAGLAGIGRLTGLRRLDLSRMPVTSAVLAQLESMPDLEVLALNRTEMNDALMKSLSGLTPLRELYLTETAVTDGGLHHLRDLTNLQVIDVSGDKIDGSGFKVFDKMKDACRLRDIIAHHTRFGDYGPRSIAGMKTLERLVLSRAAIDDKALGSFAKCPNLVELDLSFNNISPGGLKKLSRLEHVQMLRLQHNPGIVGASLSAIRKWDELKLLELDGTSVDLLAIRQMKELHPGLTIHWTGQEF